MSDHLRDHWRAARIVSRYVFRADRARATALVFVNVVVVVADFAGALVLKLLTDAAAEGSRTGVVAAAIAMAATLAAVIVGQWGLITLGMGLRERTTLYFDTRMAELAAGISHLEHYERPDYLDELHILHKNHQRLGSVHDALVSNLATLARLAVTVVLLARIHPVLLLLPLAGLPSVLVTTSTARFRRAIDDRAAAPRRLQHKLFGLATTRDPAKEIRLYDLGDDLLGRWDAARAEGDHLEDMADRRTAFLSAAGWLAFGLGFLAAMGLVAREAAAGRASPGDVVLALTLAASVNYGVTGFANGVSWLLNSLQFGARLVWLEQLAADADHRAKPRSAAPVPHTLTEGIRFEDVSFRYPGTDTAALTGVDLFFPASSTVALVGDNGAGKTTLVKLLCRFYDPTSGRVTVDGTDLRSFDPVEWRRRLSGCFQDFARLELLARETVGVGDLERLDDELAVMAALERAAASEVPANLPAGLSTLLGRSFDGGLELSAGQWQKLALGRSMMRPGALLLVLDEPTASLDPATEHSLFERYADAASAAARTTGAITVLVSHRFSTVRMADLIVVVRDGRVTEVGSHDELIARRGGTYADLYELQARAYR
jgi:ATP-binding cassette subfamily B protein